MVSSTSAYCGGCHGHWNVCYDSTYVHKAHKKKQSAGYTQAWTETPWEEDSTQWRDVQQTRSPRRRTNSPRQRSGSTKGKPRKGHPEEQTPAEYEKGTSKGKGGAAAFGFMPPSAQWMQPPVHPFPMESSSQTSTTLSVPTSTAMQPFGKSRLEKDKEDAELLALRNLSAKVRSQTEEPSEDIKKALAAVEAVTRKDEAKSYHQLVSATKTAKKKLLDLEEQWEAFRTQWTQYLDKATKMWIAHIDSYEEGEKKFAEKHREAAEYLQQVCGQLHAIHIRTMEGTLSAGELQEGQTALDASMQIEEMDDAINQPHLIQLKTDLKGVVQKVRDTIDKKITKRSLSTRQAEGDEVEVARNVDEFVTCTWRGDGHKVRRFRRLSFWPTVHNQYPDGKRTRSKCTLLSPPDPSVGSNHCGFLDWNESRPHSVVWEFNYISPAQAQTRALLLECSLTFPILSTHFDEIFFEPFIQDSRHPVPVCDLQELGIWCPLDVQPMSPDEVHGSRSVVSTQVEVTDITLQSDSSFSTRPSVAHPTLTLDTFDTDSSGTMHFFQYHNLDCQAPLSETAVLSRHSISPILYRPDPSEVPNLPDPPVFSDEDNSPRRGQRDGRRPLHHFPGWTAEIWEILQQEGAVELLEEGPIIYLGSYYVSHETCTRQPQNRPLRFDQHYEQWDEIIKDLWRDHFDQTVDYMVHLVRPEPPLSVTQGIVGVVIISQHPVVGKAAVLTTSVFDQIRGPDIVEIAHSLDLRMRYDDVLQCAEALEACQQLLQHGFGPCTIRSGRHMFPRDQDLRVHDGLGLVIRIPMMLSDEEWERRVFARLRQQHEPPEPDHPPRENAPEETDEIGFMARSPVPALNVAGHDIPSDAVTTSSSDTSSSPTEPNLEAVSDWHLVYVFTLHLPPREVEVPWNDGEELYARVARAFSIDITDIAHVFTVLHCPADILEQDHRCLILQRREDFPQVPFLQLCLTDVEYKFDHSGPASLIERRVRWLPACSNRASTIRLLGFDGHCSAHPDRCWLWHNNVYISLADPPLQLAHGDYVRLAIPAHPDQPICETGEYYWPSDLDSVYDISDDDATSFLQPLAIHCKLDSKDIVESTPLEQCTRGPEPGQALIRAHGQDEEFRLRTDPLWELWNRPALQQRNRQGEPVMIFETWFVHGARFPRCSYSRDIALGEDLDAWIQHLRQVWRDRAHPRAPVELAIVHPSVAHARHGGHLILMQSIGQEDRAVLLSSFWGSRNGALQDRFAQIVPRRLDFGGLVQFNDLTIVCGNPDFDCSAFVGPHSFMPDEVWPMYHGLHAEVVIEHIPLRSIAEAHHAALDALDFENPSSTNEQQEFQPASTSSSSFTPPLDTMSAFVQDLHSQWSIVAFNWENELASADVVTWFTDHHDPNLRACHRPRVVRLTARFTLWEATLRQVWQDHIQPTDSISFHLVHPRPPWPGYEPFPHVVLVRNRHDSLATCVLTLYDQTRPIDGPALQVALTTLAVIQLEHLLQGLDLQGQCDPLRGTLHCKAWHETQLIRHGDLIPGFNGFGIIIHLSLRRLAPITNEDDGVALLQKKTELRRVLSLDTLIPKPPSSDPVSTAEFSERLTTDTVAHGQWPETLPSYFPEIGGRIPEDWKQPDAMVLVRVLHNAPVEFSSVPDYIELPGVYSAQNASLELSSWGLDCQAFLCGTHDVIFAHFGTAGDSALYEYILCGPDTMSATAVFYCCADHPLSEHDHMKYLHKRGYTKAVLLFSETWDTNVTCLHFDDVQPQFEARAQTLRHRTPWPARQPLAYRSGPILPLANLSSDSSPCLLQFDLKVLQDIQVDQHDHLWQDYTILDLPVFIREALDQCVDIQRCDRYIIFTDGSSQTKHRHRPPEWVAEHDLSDSWAFAVFAEQYPDGPQQPSKLQFLGFQCQQVLYEAAAAHHIGTTRIGSDASETEALFWAGLWRLSRNDAIPTVFVSDSRLVGDQAAGRIGSQICDMPFQHLRALFQALAECLPEDLLRVEHVRSHAGDPFNELVDFLAKQEGQRSLFLPRQPVNMTAFGPVLRHLWMIVSQHDDVPQLTQHGLDLSPPALPAATVSEPLPVCSKPGHVVSFALGIATANVRTFYRSSAGFAGKLAYVKEQFAAHHLSFLGIQEARTDAGSSLHHDILRLAGGADKGQLGVELWVNLAQPFAWQGRRPCCFQRSDFVVLSAHPRHLLVHVKNEMIELWLLVAHAPHSGCDPDTRLTWWQMLTTAVLQHVDPKQLIVMIDANALSGPQDGRHILHFDDQNSANTVHLRDFLQAHDLYVPATSSIHQGDHTTWTSPGDDQQLRIDFVLIPCDWQSCCTHSECLDTLDFGHLGDHRAAAIQVQWTALCGATLQAPVRHCHDRSLITKYNLQSDLDRYTPCSWGTDIETQVQHFNSHLLHTLTSRCGRQPQGPKKSYITDEIWQLRGQKLRYQRHQRELRCGARRDLLGSCFHGWRNVHKDNNLIGPSPFTVHLRVRQLCLGLRIYAAAHRLRFLLARARQRAIGATIEALPSDCAASQILHTLKPILGPTNPKLKKSSPLPMVVDESGQPCRTPDDLRDRWIAFFAAMEGGERLTTSDLRSLWLQNLAQFLQQEIILQPDDLPSLADLEKAFRRVKAGKAVGDDLIPPEICRMYPVQMARWAYTQLLKLCVHGQESLLHKGGTLVAAWKRKGPQHCCESYRSLLVSSHIAKTVHRAVRDHQAEVYETYLQAEQIGGRRHIPVTMGVHYIRAAARTAKRLHRSHALIFLDLREAFYRVLRPLSIGGRMTDSVLAAMAARLCLPADALADLQLLLRDPAGTEQANMPAHMRRALQALHTNTHFAVQGQTDRVHTQIGSRPGDPFADIVFGFMFARVLSLVESRMETLGLLETYMDSPTPGLFSSDPTEEFVTHSMMGPTWMDDVCISISGATADETVHRASVATSVLLETCTAHGVSPNLDKGKSEILLSLRGRGSRALRVQYFSAVQGRCMPILTEYGTHFISVVGQYSHLGNVAHHTGTSHKEVRQRFALGNAAFSAHRRVLFQNPSFTAGRRADLFGSLVMSKIVYSMDSWVFEDKRTEKYVNSALIRLYRRLLKLAPDAALHDDEVLCAAGLPSAEIALRISRLRYLGLLYKCETVTPWAALRADTAWCALVQADLCWLWQKIANTSRLRDPMLHFADWEYVLRYHRSYWKTLIQRGLRLSVLQMQDRLLIRRLHRDIFGVFESHGSFHQAPVRPALTDRQEQVSFGCMHCSLRCRTKAGEGAHMFRKHGIVAFERRWVGGTSCEACLKEFHTHDKLQVHLRRAQICRQVLNARPLRGLPVPGIGSKVNDQLRAQHDGLLPVQRSSGPKDVVGPLREIELHHVPLFEALALQIYDFELSDCDTLYCLLQDIVRSFPVSWSLSQITLRHLRDSFTEEACTDVSLSRHEILAILDRLADPLSWPFLCEVEYDKADGTRLFALDLYEGWCDSLIGLDSPWTSNAPSCPRPFFKERIILHAYSGRRRPGDFQWYLDQLTARQSLDGVLVISLDLVIDAHWGDISNAETQRFWLEAIRSGWVIGMLSGPPCCTWSVARGRHDETLEAAGKQGPRVIRTLADLWGIESVSIREIMQLHDGHVLLGFSLHAMALLSTTGGHGVLEHPGEPHEADAASIWRLPTGLMTLNLGQLPTHLHANLVCPDLPRKGTIGVDDQGRFNTAKLKEYPPAFCKGLAEGFVAALASFPLVTEDLPSVPAFFLERCRALHCTDMGEAIGADYAGR
eukprot:s146_g26.t1